MKASSSSSSTKRAPSPSENVYWSEQTANAAYIKLNEAELAKQKLLLEPPTKKTRAAGSTSEAKIIVKRKPAKAVAVVAVTKMKKPRGATAATVVTKTNRTTKVVVVPTKQKLTTLRGKVALALAKDKKGKGTSSNVAAVKSAAVVATNKPWKKMTLAEKVNIAVQRAAASEAKQIEEKRSKQVAKLAKRQSEYHPHSSTHPINASPNHSLQHTLLDTSAHHSLQHTLVVHHLKTLFNARYHTPSYPFKVSKSLRGRSDLAHRVLKNLLGKVWYISYRPPPLIHLLIHI